MIDAKNVKTFANSIIIYDKLLSIIKVQLKNPQRIFYVDNPDTALAIFRQTRHILSIDKINVPKIGFFFLQKIGMDCQVGTMVKLPPPPGCVFLKPALLLSTCTVIPKKERTVKVRSFCNNDLLCIDYPDTRICHTVQPTDLFFLWWDCVKG